MDTLNFFRQSMAESDSVKSFIPGSVFHLDLPAARNLVRVFYELWQGTERRTIEIVNAGKSTREQVLLLGDQNEDLRARLGRLRRERDALRLQVAELTGDAETIAEYAARSAARESAAMYGTRIGGGVGRLGS